MQSRLWNIASGLVALCAMTVGTATLNSSFAQDNNATQAAENGGTGDISCVSPTAGGSPAAVSQFNANPQGLLDRNPLGGLAMVNEVRTLVVTDVNTVPGLLALAETASAGQARAIGAGLSRAAAICVGKNPALAEQIQLAVAASSNEALVTAFLTGAGDQNTAAIGGGGAGFGGGGAGAGGGAGGIGGSAAGGSTNLAGSTFASSGGSLSGGGAGGLSVLGGTGGGGSVSVTQP